MTKFKIIKADRTSIMIPNGSKYCLKYMEGKTINAVPGSYGIMTFNTLESVEMFILSNKSTIQGRHGFLIKVEPLGKLKKPSLLRVANAETALKATQDLKCFYKEIRKWENSEQLYEEQPLHTLYAPTGTECYPAVKVLGREATAQRMMIDYRNWYR